MGKITLIMNRFGHVHIFKGDKQGKLRHYDNVLDFEDKESEIYVKNQTDIEGLELFLTQQQIKDLHNGYEIVINDDMGYFQEGEN